MRRTILAVSALAVSMVAVGSAQAQQMSQQQGQQQRGMPAQQMPQQQAPDVQVSDAKMQSFVQLSKELQEIKQQYMGQIQSDSASQEQRKTLAEKANQEMRGALEESSLSIEDYNRIASALPQSRRLQQQYQKFAE